MIGVLVVDDQDLVRAGFAALVASTPDTEVVGEAATGGDAIRLARETRPDVVLMDLHLPDVDGVTAIERILAEAAPDHRPAVLVLTIFDHDGHVRSALRVGAAGFLVKDSSPQALLHGIRSVARGEPHFGPTITRRLVETYTRVPEAAPPPELAPLTEREVEVLRHVGRGEPNAAIATHLRVSEATVKTHLNRAMTKLRISSRAQAVVVAYETGLVVPGTTARPSPP